MPRSFTKSLGKFYWSVFWNHFLFFKQPTALLLVFLFVFIPLAKASAQPAATTTTVTTIYVSKFYNISSTDSANSGSSSAGTTITKHIFGNGSEIGTVTGTGSKAVPRYVHTDQLTGSNIVTNSSGTIDETLDYFPFGKLRIDSGAYSDQRKFIGQEYDSSTGLNYLNARYYNSTNGQFISQDPVFWNLGKKWLADPQNQNAYSYAGNSPITSNDPTGLLSVVIPGTWYNSNDWSANGSKSDFLSAVRNTFKDTMIVENDKSVWSGGDNGAARKSAATAIAQQINDYHFVEGEKLNIIGHSHGGNVANLVTGEINHRVDNLVTLGTPVINGYSADRANVENQVNVYSGTDLIQKGGGNQLTTSGFAGAILGSLLGPTGESLGWSWGNSLGWGQFGSASRSLNGANNINVTWQTLNPFHAHGDYLSPSIWSQVDKKIK